MNRASAYKPPFKYEPYGQMVFDMNGQRVADIRGWGHLTGRNGMNLPEDQAANIMDNFGEHLVKVLNSHDNFKNNILPERLYRIRKIILEAGAKKHESWQDFSLTFSCMTDQVNMLLDEIEETVKG